MTVAGWIQILALVAVLTALTPLLGGYMARVYEGERVALGVIVAPIERVLYLALRGGPSGGNGMEAVRARGAVVQSRDLARALPDTAHAGGLAL